MVHDAAVRYAQSSVSRVLIEMLFRKFYILLHGSLMIVCIHVGKWLPLMCTMNCTGCPEEVQNAFSLSLKEATDLAAQEPPGCEGVNILPYFMGERTPDWPHSRGSILGLTPGMLQRPGLLYRSALEGSTFSLATGIALCAPHSSHACSSA